LKDTHIKKYKFIILTQRIFDFFYQSAISSQFTNLDIVTEYKEEHRFDTYKELSVSYPTMK